MIRRGTRRVDRSCVLRGHGAYTNRPLARPIVGKAGRKTCLRPGFPRRRYVRRAQSTVLLRCSTRTLASCASIHAVRDDARASRVSDLPIDRCITVARRVPSVTLPTFASASAAATARFARGGIAPGSPLGALRVLRDGALQRLTVHQEPTKFARLSPSHRQWRMSWTAPLRTVGNSSPRPVCRASARQKCATSDVTCGSRSTR